MSGSQNKFNPFDVNWKEFGKQFAASHQDARNQDLSWIEEYVQDILSQVLSDGGIHNSDMSSIRRPNVMNTHQYIIVRIPVPKRANTRKLKVLFNANQICLSGLGEEDQVIPLPSPGRYDGSKALFKDNILEIRIPKEINETYQEVNIQFV